MATRSFTVRHTCSHSPHPTHRSFITVSRWLSKFIDKASVGHFDAQAWHPCPAVQIRCETTASPIRICARPSTGSSASVAQAAIQGVSSQRKQGICSAKITGVPSKGWNVIDPYGQTLPQSPHRVHRSKNSASSVAPGGRNQSVRTGGGTGCSVTTACCLANSCAAFATDTTESLRKSRRPYGESLATVVHHYMTPSARSL